MEHSSETVENDISPKQEEKKKMSGQKIKILAAVIYGNLFLGGCYSLIAPIFPAEAEKKGASPSSYGLVFGIYQLTMFLASPFYGKLIPKLTPSFMMKVGMSVSGVSVILFGLLDFAPPGPIFIALALTIRTIDALGASAFLTASYTTLGYELPDVIGRAMAVTETAFALGLSGGPVVGGYLFEVGGFQLPFYVMGAILIAGTAVNMFCFPKDGKIIQPQAISVKQLLSDIDFLIDVISVGSCFAAMVFNEATLEPHIRQFNLTPTITGAMFLLSGLTDAVFSPVWGYFSEKVGNAQYLTLAGNFLIITSFLLVGPVPFLKFKTNFGVVIFSQILLGLGMAAEIVCGFAHGMNNTIERGYPNEVGTYSLISGVLFSSSCFGAFVGPSVGGVLVDNIGYIGATEVIVGVKCVVAVICASRLIFLCKSKKKKSEIKRVNEI